MVVLPFRQACFAAVVCMAGVIVFHATHPGLAHTFFNPAAGGPNNGWRHLGHSNVDWGQSTYRIVDWVKQYPGKRPLTVFFALTPGRPERLLDGTEDVSTADFRGSGKRCERPPSGWYLISSEQLTLVESRYFRTQDPTDARCDHLAADYSEQVIGGRWGFRLKQRCVGQAERARRRASRSANIVVCYRR